jgi:restriction endonuclease S subunit
MNGEALLDNFDVVAEAPGGIGFLKKLILVNAASGAFLQNGRHSGSANSKKTLGELCDIYQPKTISIRELIEDGKYLVYGANGVIGRYDKFNHEFEEVLVTCRGATCGTVNVSSPKSWINGNAMVVRPKTNGLSKEFLAVILRGVDFASVITGTAQPQITRQPLSKISIFVPTVPEQKRIVAKVDELMALCDQLELAKNQRDEIRTATQKSAIDAISTAATPEELETAWKRISEHWEDIFIDAKSVDSLRDLVLTLALEGRLLCSTNLSKKKVAPLLDRAACGTDVRLRERLPTHWDVISFYEHFDMKGGGQPPKSVFVDKMRPGYVRLFQIRDYGANPVPVFIPEQLARKKSRKGEILVARYGASGKVFWAEEGAYNVALAKLTFPEGIVLKEFAFLLFKSKWFQNPIRSTTRVAVDGFNKSDLKTVYFPLPPIREQQEIVEIFERISALCNQIEVALQAKNELARRYANSVVGAA